jgi:hypothetical protein
MDPTISYKNKILEIIEEKKQVSAKQIKDILQISEPALFKHLKTLLASHSIKKIGKSPRVFYMPNTPDSQRLEDKDVVIEKDVQNFINENFIVITPSGEMKSGMDGFAYWCHKTKQPVEKTANDYFTTLKKYQDLKKDNLIDASSKLETSFSEVYLDKLFYIDFYSVERFGKTKLGQLLLYAKQNQNKKLIKTLSHDIKPVIKKLLKKAKIDGIGYIPPTVKREVQFMTELEKDLSFNTPKLEIFKVSGEISIPQKTLTKLEDRIENAQKTLVVNNNKKFKNILLIDDAVGSGATLNETARKIREQKLCTGKILGLSLTGSFKGFDVISEV